MDRALSYSITGKYIRMLMINLWLPGRRIASEAVEERWLVVSFHHKFV